MMSRENCLGRKKIIIILGTIWLLSLVASYWNKKVIPEKVGYVTLKDISHKENLFTIEEIMTLEKKYPELSISYGIGATATLNVGDRKCTVWLVQTNENYRKWNNLSMQQGAFLQENIYNNKQIVIDDKVAFRLFGSTVLSDIEVELAPNKYRVNGITKQQKYDTYKYKQQGIVGNAYYIGEKKDTLLNGFILCDLENEKLKNQEIVNLLLATLGRNKEEYSYISIDEYKQKFNGYMKCIRFSMLMMILIIIWLELIKQITIWLKEGKSKLKSMYLMEYLRQDKKKILKRVCLVVVMGIAFCLIGGYFANEILELMKIKDTLGLRIQEYPRPIQLIYKGTQLAKIGCYMVVILLLGIIVKRK